ncbi:CAP domain-containing protein [Mycolicibacterium moriokaense]|nr:CAP domain-containing protein [Mycolicibacterium moriokaense]
MNYFDHIKDDGVPIFGNSLADSFIDDWDFRDDPKYVYCRVQIDGKTRVNKYRTDKIDCRVCAQDERGDDLLDYFNVGRERHGVRRVEIDDELMNLARAKSEDMAIHNYMDHQDLHGNWPKCAEILTRRLSAYDAFDSWRVSSGHHDVMMKPHFTRCGFARVGDRWTAQFR